MAAIFLIPNHDDTGRAHTISGIPVASKEFDWRTPTTPSISPPTVASSASGTMYPGRLFDRFGTSKVFPRMASNWHTPICGLLPPSCLFGPWSETHDTDHQPSGRTQDGSALHLGPCKAFPINAASDLRPCACERTSRVIIAELISHCFRLYAEKSTPG